MLRGMSPTIRSAGGILLTFGVAAAFGTAVTIRAGQAPATTTRDAMYTSQQAAAGESLYRRSSAAC